MDNFRQIKDFPNYGISKQAQIINLKSKRIIKNPTINNCGYRLAVLSKKGKKYCRPVHRLVASAWLNLNLNSKLEVDHVDGDKLNNSLENLRICTKSENQLYFWSKNRRDLFYIYYRPDDSKKNPWRVKIHNSDRIRVFDKSFPTKEEAQSARDKFLSTSFTNPAAKSK